MKRRILSRNVQFIMLIMFISFLSNPCFANYTNSDRGTAAAQFLKLGIGGRATAMGNAIAAIVDDSTSICWNPAGLSKVSSTQVALMHSIYLGNIFYDYITYADPVENLGTFGLGIQYLNYGSMKETDENGTELGDLTAYDLSITIGYAAQIYDISFGVAFKYLNSKIKNYASAIAFDAGLQYPLIENQLLVGLVMQNYGTKMKFIDEYNSLPFNIKAGVAYKIFNNLTAEIDANLPIDNSLTVGIGLEYYYPDESSWSISPRVGYNTEAAEISGFKGFSFGLGINNCKDYGLDYSFVPFGEIGSTHRITLYLRF